MNEQDLISALDDRVADLPVGAPPLAAMTRSAGARRRRTRLAALAAAAAVVVAAGGLSVLLDDAPGTSAPVATEPTTAPTAPPAGQRWVGVGHAAIAVPEGWPTNAVTCGQPTETTVVIDQGAVCRMFVPFPEAADSVAVGRVDALPHDAAGWDSIDVDGHEAFRSPPIPTDSGVPFAGAVYVPAEHALFTASSSISQSHVDDLLDNIVVLDDLVAVPGLADGGGAPYDDRLAELGLEIQQVAISDVRGPDLLRPAAGTMVPVGSVVTVQWSQPS